MVNALWRINQPILKFQNKSVYITCKSVFFLCCDLAREEASQHFLLSPKARTLSFRRIHRLSDDEAYAEFVALRFAGNTLWTTLWKRRSLAASCQALSTKKAVLQRLSRSLCR